jgi:hypothetical protein
MMLARSAPSSSSSGLDIIHATLGLGPMAKPSVQARDRGLPVTRGRRVSRTAWSSHPDLSRTASVSTLIVILSLRITPPEPGITPLKVTPKSVLSISPVAEKPALVPP